VLPRVNDPVTLTLPDREMLPGRVDEVGFRRIDVALLAAPRTPVDVLQHSVLFLEWAGREGVHRLLGHASLLDGVPQGDSFGVFDVARFEFRAEAMLLQRREHVRTEYTAAVTISPSAGDAPAVAARTVNISASGLLVRGPLRAQVGEEADFRLAPLDDVTGRTIRGGCRIVRRTPSGDHAIQFTSILEADRDHLMLFAYERELAARERKLAA
jgi:hypothetical protein